VRHAVAKHDPPVRGADFASARESDMHGFVGVEAGAVGLFEKNDCPGGGIGGENAPLAPRRISGGAEAQEEHDAQRDPRRVERAVVASERGHDPYNNRVTRADIEARVLDIIRKEKPIDPKTMTRDTSLAEAGIDSLDSLTILFGIEEEFKLSISDQDARTMKTFGDMVDTIERLLPTPSG
jgi:acyl carrier protein